VFVDLAVRWTQLGIGASVTRFSLKASRVRVLLALGLLASVVGASVSWLVANAQSVGAGQSHSAVHKTGGRIAIWGYNSYGQIGDGTNTQRNVPVELPGLIPRSPSAPSTRSR